MTIALHISTFCTSVEEIVRGERCSYGMFTSQPRSKSMKLIFEIMGRMTEEADVLKKYGVDKYLGALGLSVNKAFSGQGLGEELLRAR